MELSKTWYSLDKALGGGFMPYTFNELSGWPATGKSSICTGLAGLFNPTGTVVYCPFEDYTQDYIERGLKAVGWHGKLEVVNNLDGKKDRTPEQMLDELCDAPLREDVTAIIWDSIGNTPITAELEGSVAEAHMGGRARTIKFVISKIGWRLRQRVQTGNPCIAFATNHVHSIMGSRGTVTSGGMAVLYNTGTRLRLSKVEEFNNEVITVEGRVDRLKFKPGVELAEKFWAVISPKTHGFHPGLTALYDCEKYGLCTRENGTIKIGAKSFGRLNTLCDKANDDDLFKPFFELLKKKG